MSLKQIIKNQGRTQRWVAQELGLNEDAVSRILRGKQSLPLAKVESLAKMLGVEVAEIVRAASPNSSPVAAAPIAQKDAP